MIPAQPNLRTDPFPAGSDEREGGPWAGADRYGDVDADEDGDPGGPEPEGFEDEDMGEVSGSGFRSSWGDAHRFQQNEPEGFEDEDMGKVSGSGFRVWVLSGFSRPLSRKGSRMRTWAR